MRDFYGSSVKFYAEDNDISCQEAFDELHCQENEIEAEINDDGEMIFTSVTEYIKWIKNNKKNNKGE